MSQASDLLSKVEESAKLYNLICSLSTNKNLLFLNKKWKNLIDNDT
jgi:hypothetical protein